MRGSVVQYGADLDVDAFVDASTTEPWGDGLPFEPFDGSAHAEALRQLGLDGAAPVGGLPITTAELCALALLAGCRPLLLPAVLGAVLAVDDHLAVVGRVRALDPEASRAVFLNGSARERLGVNSGLGLMGPGFPSNATIGRALQLALRYCGMGRSRQFGDPAQYTLAFGEDERQDWIPYHVQRGYAPVDSTVSVFTYRKAGRVFDRTSRSVDEGLDKVALYLRDYASATDWFGHQPLSMLVAIGEEWRRQFVGEGLTKTRIRDEIFGRAVDPERPGRTPHFAAAEDLSLVGCGGPADASIWFFVGTAGGPMIRQITDPKE
jgi:hypothetical protein